MMCHIGQSRARRIHDRATERTISIRLGWMQEYVFSVPHHADAHKRCNGLISPVRIGHLVEPTTPEERGAIP